MKIQIENKPENAASCWLLWTKQKVTFGQDLVRLKICLSRIEFYLSSITPSHTTIFVIIKGSDLVEYGSPFLSIFTQKTIRSIETDQRPISLLEIKSLVCRLIVYITPLNSTILFVPKLQIWTKRHEIVSSTYLWVLQDVSLKMSYFCCRIEMVVTIQWFYLYSQSVNGLYYLLYVNIVLVSIIDCIYWVLDVLAIISKANKLYRYNVFILLLNIFLKYICYKWKYSHK